MKRIVGIFLQLLFFVNIGAFAQSTKVKLFIGMNDLGPATNSFIAANNIPNVPIFNAKDIDPGNVLKLDEQAFTNAIEKRIPNTSVYGYAVIDWEGKIEVPLEFGDANSPEYQSSLAEFTKTIELAKKLRPKMKWGFFGMPFPPLDKRDTRTNNIVTPLLQLSDVFYPQFYVPYNMKQAQTGSRSIAEKDQFVSDNLLQALTLAQQMNKPVIVFVWHRFYSAGFKQNSLQLIPLNEFDEYMKEILALNYKGKKVEGLILWGADTYYYSVKSKPVVDEFDGSKSKDFKSYHDSLIYKYMKRLNQTAK